NDRKAANGRSSAWCRSAWVTVSSDLRRRLIFAVAVKDADERSIPAGIVVSPNHFDSVERDIYLAQHLGRLHRKATSVQRNADEPDKDRRFVSLARNPDLCPLWYLR